MNPSNSKPKRTLIAALLFIFVSWAFFAVPGRDAYSQDPRTVLFEEADKAMLQAKSVQADVFSPTQYESGIKYYLEAETDYKKGGNLEDVRKKLKMSTVYFLKAVETTRLAETNMVDCLNVRSDALSAGAPQVRKAQWDEAELALNEAVRILEQGNLANAKSRARKAERLYKAVELESIKANFLDETRALLVEAKDKDVKRYAPATLANAEEVAQKAEAALSENRYDTDEVRLKAQDAKYQALHALHLAEAIKTMTEEKKTVESMLLEAEKPIQTIGDEFDLNSQFHQGTDQPVAAIISEIQKLKKEKASLEQDLADKREQVARMTERIGRMESQLGDLKTKEATLTELIDQQKIARERFERVEKTFAPQEAQILRIGDQTVIRLYGLTFPSGKSTIEPKYFGLISKVLKATDEYPGCDIAVEGHTDSYGGDETNLKLSTERAEAVKAYLSATGGMDASRIQAVGYGESKPIASNETDEGRRKNRRIEIVIHPKK